MLISSDFRLWSRSKAAAIPEPKAAAAAPHSKSISWGAWLSIDPANQFLYVANGSAGTVTSVTLNAATGALTLMPGSPFAAGHIARFSLSVIALIAFTACGGGGSPPPPVGRTASGGTDSGSAVTGPNTTYTVGGTVSGLVGQGLTIELLNLANLAHHPTVLEQIDIVADGAFVFRIPPSQRYGVAIVHQPHAATQRCVVRNGQGVIGTTNVTDVGIVC